MIYFLPVYGDKPIKLVYEGDSYSNIIEAFDTANLTNSTTINKSYGIAIATNAIAGLIVLS